MTEEGTNISRFVTEREWFRLQYDRHVGPPPDQSNEPKFKDVFAEIRRKAQDRPVKEAKYIKEVPLREEDVTYLDWKAAPPMVYCSCPQTKCICNSNKLLDDQDIPTAKRYEPNVFQRIFSCCCSYAAPEPAGTLVPRLMMAARTEMAVTNAMLERGLTQEKGPEFCMSGCQKFYLNENQQLKAPRSQSKSDIHCVAEVRIMRDEFERLKEYAEDFQAPSEKQMRKISENCQLHGIKPTNFSSSTLSNSQSLHKQDPYKPLPRAYAGGENVCPCQQRNSIQIAQKNPPQTRLKTDIRGSSEMRLLGCMNSSNTCCRKKETVQIRLKKVYCDCKRYIRRERIIEMRRQRRLEIEHRNDIKRRLRLERENMREMKREMKRQMKLERQKMRELQREMRRQKKLEKKTSKQAPSTKKNKTIPSKNEVIEATHVCDAPKLIPTKIRSFEIKEKEVRVFKEEEKQKSLDKVREIPTVSDKNNCSHSYKFADLQSEQSVPDKYNNNIPESCNSLLQSQENSSNMGYSVGKENQNVQALYKRTLTPSCDIPKLIQTKTNSFETKPKQVSMEQDCQISLDKVREIPTVSNKYNCSHNYKYADLQSNQSVPDNYNNNISQSCDSLLRSPENKPNKRYFVGKESQNIRASHIHTRNCDVPKLIQTKTYSFETKEKQVSMEEDCQISVDTVREIPTVSNKYNCSYSYKYADLQSKQSVPDNYNNNIPHSCDSLLQSPENKPNKGYSPEKESQNVQASYKRTLTNNSDVPKLIQKKTHSLETKPKQVSTEEDYQISLDKVRKTPTVSNKYNCSHSYKYADLQSKQSVPDNHDTNIPHSCDSLLQSPEKKPNKGYLVGKENQNIQASFFVFKTTKNHNNFSCECNFFKNHYTQCILSDIYQDDIGMFDIREAVNKKNVTTKENFVNVNSSQLRGTVTDSKQKKTSDKNVGFQYAKELISKEVSTFNSEQQNRRPTKVKSENNVLHVNNLKLVNGKCERPRDVSIQNILYASQNNAIDSNEMLNSQKTEREEYRNVDCECKILDCSVPKKDGVTQSNDVVSYISRHEADGIKRIRKKSDNIKSKNNIKKQLNINKSHKVERPKNKDIKCECGYFAKGSVISLQEKLILNSEHTLGDTSRVKDDKTKIKGVEIDTKNIRIENIPIENSKYIQTLKNIQSSTICCLDNSCKHVKNEKKYLLENVKNKCPNEKNKLLCQTRSRSLHSGISNTCTHVKLFDNDQEKEKKIPLQSFLRDPDRYSMFKDMKYKSTRNNTCDDHDNFGKIRSNSTLNSCLSQDICLCSDSDEPPTGICKNKINVNILFSRSSLEIFKKEKPNSGHSLCNVNKLRVDPPAPPKIHGFTPKINTDTEERLEDVNLHPSNLPRALSTCSDKEQFPGSNCKFLTRKREQVTHNKFDQIFKTKKPAETLHTLCNKNNKATIETKNDSSKASTGVIWINSKSELRSENLNFPLHIANSGNLIKNKQTDSKCIDSNWFNSNTKNTVNPIESKLGNSIDTNSNHKFGEIAIKSTKGTPKVTNVNEVCKPNTQQVTYKFIHEVKEERKENYRQKCKCSIIKMHNNIKHIPSKVKCCFDSTSQKETSQDTNSELLNELKRTAGSLLNVESLKTRCSFSGLKSSMNLFKEPKVPITNRAKPQAGKGNPKKFTACMLQTKKCKKPRRLNSKDTIVLNKLHTQKTVNY